MLNYSKCLEENLHEKLKFWKKFKYWHQHFVPKKKAFPQADTITHKQTQFLKQANKGETNKQSNR